MLVVASVALAVSGCGGGGDSDSIKAAFADFATQLHRHNAAAACRDVTSAYWSATAAQATDALAGSGQTVPAECQAGLRYLLSLAGNAPTPTGGASLINIAVHGSSATARETSRAGPGQPVKFVKLGGRWRIDCCVGHQLEQQPQSLYRVPSPAMLPTLQIGQIVTSDNAALRSHPPPLGAIVVFHPPAGADPAGNPVCGTRHQGAGFQQACGAPTNRESAQTFIKRVVGLPGDRIAIVNGQVIRNGQAEVHSYKLMPCNGDPECNFPKPVTIPPDEYFVLGDNRPASDDSRFWGPVKRSWLIGIVRAP
jgi:signal peptidase I